MIGRSSFVLAAVLLMSVPFGPGSASAGKSSSQPAVSRDGWPETPAGAMARRWVEAFSKGDSAMRACLTQNLAPESLELRGIEERLQNYRASKERFGSLVLVSIDKDRPSELEATLMASDLTQHRFVFTVQATAPYKLISVGRMEYRHGGHGFGH